MSATLPIPAPRGDYRPATRHGTVIYTAGVTPRKDGELTDVGTVGADINLNRAQAAARQAITNALAAVESCLTVGEVVTQFLRMTVFIASAPTFTEHSKVADAASEVLRERHGAGALGPRTAVGVACLPGRAPVEIELTAAVHMTGGRTQI